MNSKRAFDIIASITGLLLLLPLLVVVSLIIKIDSTGPIFFRQERIGRFGKPFRIHKFRTMQSITSNQGMQITVGADSRITKIGKYLRQYKLDELPQLIDVLLGRMSIVGPRPEVSKYVDLYPVSAREKVLSIRPGITDFSSIHFRSENELLATQSDPEKYYIEQIIPIKLRYHIEYAENMSLGQDLAIIFKTFLAIIR